MKGYTLIELMVVIAISGILVTIGYVNALNYSRSQQLTNAGRSLSSDLKSAQDLSIAGNKPTGCGANILNGYQFKVNSGSSYEIDANCSSNTIVVSKQVSLPSGLTIANPNPNPIIFKSLAQGTNIPNGNTISITVTQTSTGNRVSITVGSNGSIK